MNTTDYKGPTPWILDSVGLEQSSRTALCPMFQDGTVAGLSGPHLTNTALEIQYLTERFDKGKLLKGKREMQMQMQMHSLGRGRRGKPWLPQSVSGKAQCHHSCHDALHPPTLPPSLEFVAGGHFSSHSETNACPVHWIWIY